MKKQIIILLSLIIGLQACNPSDNHKGNLTVKGTVKGLRLGTLLLKQIKKDSLQAIDSIKVDGQEKFEFHTNIDEAQMMILQLPEVKNGNIKFFASPKDTIRIFTYVESFGFNNKISGGENQTALNSYNDMINKFNNKELDLFKAKFDAAKIGLQQEADSLGKAMDRLKRKRFLYTLNFIMNNKDKAVSPYVALQELSNNPKALDTVFKSLTTKQQDSKYGKEIKKVLFHN